MDDERTYAVTEVGLIAPSPMNPRKHFPQQALDELVGSIKQKGVIEPIIIRPVKGKERPFEIVVGERRYRAAVTAGLGGIPTITRQLTDEEAYDFMLVENLHREDLTTREEAESFRAYIDRHGDDGIPELAEKTGIKPGYIRSRIKVLELPEEVLAAWDKGEIAFGHLQQLLRVHDEKDLAEAIETLFRWNNPPSVKEFAQDIIEAAPPLSAARFKTKAVCSGCHHNSLVQRELFDIETDKKARCLNAACFKQHQAEWLDEHWQETDIAREHRTNGYRFEDDISYNDYRPFYTWGPKPKGKCYKCPHFVSIIEIPAKVTHRERVCLGDKACFEAVTAPKTKKESTTGEPDPEAPRAAWHGAHFRDAFFCRRIPEVLATIDPDDPRIKELLLACAIHHHTEVVSDAFFDEEGCAKDIAGYGFDDFEDCRILEKPKEEKQAIFKKVIEAIILAGEYHRDWDGFDPDERWAVAKYLGIDLAKEFAVDQDYLEKKTKAEILAFGKKFKLFKPEEAGKLKKAELVKLVLSHGDELIGKVPEEILKGAA